MDKHTLAITTATTIVATGTSCAASILSSLSRNNNNSSLPPRHDSASVMATVDTAANTADAALTKPRKGPMKFNKVLRSGHSNEKIEKPNGKNIRAAEGDEDDAQNDNHGNVSTNNESSNGHFAENSSNSGSSATTKNQNISSNTTHSSNSRYGVYDTILAESQDLLNAAAEVRTVRF